MSIESMARQIAIMESRLKGIAQLVENQGEIDLNVKYGIALKVIQKWAQAALAGLSWGEEEEE